MLSNIGIPGLLIIALALAAILGGIYSIAKIPNSDERFFYAGFWLRFAANIIDSLIMLPLAFGIGYASGYLLGPGAEPTAQVMGIALGWIYGAGMESSILRGTIGKRLLGLRVVDLDGARISFWKATGRYFAKALSLLTLFIGFYMIGLTKKKQGLHDLLSGCLVVRHNSPTLRDSL